MSVKHLCLIAVAATLGCASGSGTSERALNAQSRMATVLTYDELASAKADVGTAYDAIARLRPNWLAPHGTMSSNPEANQYATVYMDGQQIGSIESLRRINAYNVAQIRYHDITQAGARFGIRGGMGGVIEVESRVK